MGKSLVRNVQLFFIDRVWSINVQKFWARSPANVAQVSYIDFTLHQLKGCPYVSYWHAVRVLHNSIFTPGVPDLDW